jgi:hypothetical protein
MMRDITDDVPNAATDTLSYEDRLLCFQDAREAPRALWHWQEIDTATCSMENTGHDALADTPFFTDSFLGILAESAPQDQHVRAPVDTAQAPLAIFFTKEDIPCSSPTPPPAFEDAPHTTRGSVDTPPSAPADLERAAPAPTVECGPSLLGVRIGSRQELRKIVRNFSNVGAVVPVEVVDRQRVFKPKKAVNVTCEDRDSECAK